MVTGDLHNEQAERASIIAPSMPPIDVTARQTKSYLGSFILSWLARLAAVAVLIGSGYMFYRFAENDFGTKVLLWAFALCFGAGALAYGPLFIIAGLLKRSRKKPTKRQAVWVLALSLPWCVAGGILITYPNAMRYLGLASVGFSGLFALWSVFHWQRIRRLSC
ncbi:MAG: hypothetical protein ABJ275_11175 [Maricaulaceae bacterium]